MSDTPEDQLRELVEYLATSLVDSPDEVHITTLEEGRKLIFELGVAPDDLGKVIGKDGRTARAIRALLASSSARLDRRAVLDIVE